MRHLEERLKVLQMDNSELNRPGDGASGLYPSAQEFLLSVDPPLLSYSSHDLSRSQLAARQAVAKELPTFAGASEEWPLFIATYESTTRTRCPEPVVVPGRISRSNSNVAYAVWTTGGDNSFVGLQDSEYAITENGEAYDANRLRYRGSEHVCDH